MTCQMDYLCELPTDSARKKALDSLPPTLDATYARILRRVQESNHDVQVMVQRSLRWIAHARRPLDVTGLCEAISIDPGDTFINREGIPAVEEILRCCSSLVRKSADGYSLEFAHFTVEEYLQKLDQVADNEFGVYHIKYQPCQIELAEACLTYLNLGDFGQVDLTDEEAQTRRMKDYALRSYAVRLWLYHARENMANERIFHLVQQLFCPSKSSNFITWARDYNVILRGEDHYYYPEEDFDHLSFDAVNSRLATTGPLHYAALLAIPELCTWLLDEGCEVNQGSPCGTPLRCTILGIIALTIGKARISQMSVPAFGPEFEDRKATLITLLESGADPNCYCDDGERNVSLLSVAAYFRWKYSCLELLRRGAVVDEYAKTQFRRWKNHYHSRHNSKDILRAEIGREDLEENDYASILERMLASDEFMEMDESDLEQPVSGLQYGDAINHFFLAAKFGQFGIISRLLLSDSFDPNLTEAETGRTALHYAAENGHNEVVTLLLVHGADSNVIDNDGRTPISLATEATESQCFISLLRQGCDINVKDREGYTIVHDVAENGNVGSLIALREHLEVSVASQYSKAVENSATRLNAELGIVGEGEITPTGQNFLQAISQKTKKGETPLHLAAEVGSLDVLRYLLDNDCDPKTLMDDGSTALHCIAKSGRPKQSHVDIMNVLLEHQVDPCHPRCDGATPLHIMIQGSYRWSAYSSIRLEIFEILARSEGTLLQTDAEGLTVLHLHLRTCSRLLIGGKDVLGGHDSEDEAARLVNMLTLLLEAGAHLQALDPENGSALHYLASTFTATTTTLGQATLSQMMSIAIDHVGKDENLVKIITDPALLVLAIKFGQSELVQKLLDKSPQADTKATTPPAMTPIQAACRYGCDRKNLLRLLDLSSARCDPAGLGSELLRLACQRNDGEAYASALVLLEAGFDPSKRSSKGENALMLAARAGNVDIVKLLISHDVDPSVSDAKGCNVAHYALEGGYVEVIHALKHCKLDWGAKGELSIHGETLKDVTALHLAALLRDNTLLGFLIDEKLISDIDCVMEDRVTPLFIAVWSKTPSNVAVLLSKKADVDVVTMSGGESPLHLATRFGNRDIVSQFLRHGCDVTIPTKAGLDCQMIALKYGFKDLAETIAEFAQKQGMY